MHDSLQTYYFERSIMCSIHFHILLFLVSTNFVTFLKGMEGQVKRTELKTERKRIAEYTPSLSILKKLVPDKELVTAAESLSNSTASQNPSCQEFLSLSQWGSNIVQLMLKASSDEELCNLLQYAREYVSYFPWPLEELDLFERFLVEGREKLEGTLEQSNSAEKCRWPHQNRFEAFMGHLFFPVQCEFLFEVQEGLQLREHMQNLLAIAASYKNTLAQRHMVDIIGLYEEDEQEESDSYEIQSQKRKHVSSPFGDYFGADAQGQFDDYTAQYENALAGRPYYFCGLLNTMNNNYRRALACFKAGCEAQDPWSTYRFVRELHDEDERRSVKEKLALLHSGLAKFVEGENVENHDVQRVADYEAAGKAGIAEGYRKAAILCSVSSSVLNDQAYIYYCLAAQHHILEAFDSVAEILLKDNQKGEAQEAYLLQARWGELQGYVKQGVLLLQEVNYSRALDSFKKAGLAGYSQRLLCASRNEQGDLPIEEVEREEFLKKEERLRFLLKKVKHGSQ